MARDVSEDLVSFLRAEIDADAVPVPFGVDADIGFAEYDDVQQDVYVTPVSEDPIVPGGGTTQFTGLDSAGGPIQDRVWLVLVDCWGGRVDADIYQQNGSHPDTVANNLGHQVANACIEAAADDAPDGYEWISADPPSTANDPTRSKTYYRRNVTCRLKETH